MAGQKKTNAQDSTGSEPAAKTKAGRIIRGLAPWAVSLGIIAYLVSTEDMAGVAGEFMKGDAAIFFEVVIPFLLALLALETVFLYLGFQWFAGAGRMADLLRARAATYLLTVISIFVGLGGLVVYGKRRYGVSYTRGTTIMLNELLHELASQCTLAMMVGLLLPVSQIPEGAAAQVNGVKTVGMVGVSFYIFCVLLARASRLLPEGWRKDHVFDKFVDIDLWQYAVFYLIKLAQNIVYGLFLAGLLLAFSVKPPLIVSLGFMQIIHLTRAIPVSAFGIGVDQIAVEYLFKAWETSPGQLLACSVVFTFTLIAGRALLGVPFLKGVFDDLVEKSDEESL
jgi:hypothetical protein